MAKKQTPPEAEDSSDSLRPWLTRIGAGLLAMILLRMFVAMLFGRAEPGAEIDAYRGVPVYNQVELDSLDNPLHLAEDGFVYGAKWDADEFVRRFFREVHGKDIAKGLPSDGTWFNERLKHGKFNRTVGLQQFRNGGDEPPRTGDLIVLRSETDARLGIICGIEEFDVEIMRQNARAGTRTVLRLRNDRDVYILDGEGGVQGWLRPRLTQQ